MENSYYPFIILIVYVIVLIFLALQDARKHSVSQYVIGQRKVGAFATMAAIAGNLRDGAGLAAWVILGIYYGFGALWLTLGLSAGLILMAIFAPKIRELAETHDYISISQLVKERIGITSSNISSLLISVTALLYAAAQVYVSGNIFASIFGLTSKQGIILTASVVGLYLYLGGYYTTIRTGVVQWFIIMIIIIIPWLIPSTQSINVEFSTFFKVDFLTSFSFFMISFLVVFSSADLWQLVFSANSKRSVQRGFLLTIPVYILISIGLVYFATASYMSVGNSVDPSNVFFALFTLKLLPTLVIGIIGVFVAASIMSTLDSQVFLFISTLSRQVLPNEVDSHSPKMLKVFRWSLILTMIILTLLTSLIGDLIEFLFGAVTLATILVPIFIVSIVQKSKHSKFIDTYVSIIMIVASIVYIYLFTTGAYKNLIFTLIPAAVSTVGILFMLIINKFRQLEKA